MDLKELFPLSINQYTHIHIHVYILVHIHSGVSSSYKESGIMKFGSK